MDPPRKTPDLPLRWGAAAGWAVLVAVVLWSSGPEEPLPWPWLAAFERAGGDKLVHAGLFGVQAWLLCRCRPGSREPGWLTACLAAAVAYGVGTELGQLPLSGRDASFGDGLADAAGATLAVAWVAFRRRAVPGSSERGRPAGPSS